MSCQICKHLHRDLSCDAFDVIPLPFLSGSVVHDKPIKGQKNKIVFEQGMNEVLQYQLDKADELMEGKPKTEETDAV